jgi:hypothetical protein
MAVVDAMTLVLEFTIDVPLDFTGLLLGDYLRDLCALRATHRRREDIEARADLIIMRGGCLHFRVNMRRIQSEARYMMTYLRAVIREDAASALIFPEPVAAFGETNFETLYNESNAAVERLREVRNLGRRIDLGDDDDYSTPDDDAPGSDDDAPGSDDDAPGSDDESMTGTEISIASGSMTTREPVDGDGVESFSDAGSDVSMVNHADEDRVD